MVPAGGACSMTVSWGCAARRRCDQRRRSPRVESSARLGERPADHRRHVDLSGRASGRRRTSAADHSGRRPAAAIAASASTTRRPPAAVRRLAGRWARGARRAGGAVATRRLQAAVARAQRRRGRPRRRRARAGTRPRRRSGSAGPWRAPAATTASSAGVTSGLSCAGRPRLLGDLLQRHGHRRVGLERDPAGERLVEDHPDRVEVGRRGHVEALRLLRRQVLGRPEHRSRLRDLRGSGAGDAEVGHPGAPLTVDEHVLWLEIAVDDASLVREPAPSRTWRTISTASPTEMPRAIRSLSEAPSTYSIAMYWRPSTSPRS